MHTISRDELPCDIFTVISVIQQQGVWSILELKPDHAMFYHRRSKSFMTLISRKNDFLLERFESREKATNFIYGMLI